MPISHSMRRAGGLAAFVLATAALPSATYAQSNTSALPADSTAGVASVDGTTATGAVHRVSVSGPRVAPVALVRSSWTLPQDAPAIPSDPGANVGPNLALMGVGAAAVVVGLLIGGDGGHAVAVGGAVIGLVGLYRYMR